MYVQVVDGDKEEREMEKREGESGRRRRKSVDGRRGAGRLNLLLCCL